MVIPFFLLSLTMAVLLCWHAVRTGRDSFWLWIILMFQPIGGAVYFFLNVVPDIFGGAAAHQATRAARQGPDPNREYREAERACEETPTVRNQSRLAHAAAHLGHHAEAEALYAAAAQGVHADDPALLLGRAKALLELGRAAEALATLEKLGEDEAHGRTPPAALAMARAYDALGRTEEADRAFQWASERMPGFEALARYAAFMAHAGRKDEARDIVRELDLRMAKLRGQFRREAQGWRDLAAAALDRR